MTALFGFVFSLLTDLGIRGEYREEIFDSVSDHVYPFATANL